jgi:hypothetical protein
MRSMLLAGFVALTAIAATSLTPAYALRSTILGASPTNFLPGNTSSPSTQIRGGKAISNCFPVHKIANGFDYCTNTPILH